MRLDDAVQDMQLDDCQAQTLSLLRVLLSNQSFRAGTTEFLSRLAHVLGCERVSLGIVAGKSIKLCAVSHCYQKIDPAVVPEVVAAMEESVLQDATLAYPHLPSEFPYIVVAHHRLATANHLSCVLTVPLGEDGKLVGAITLETRQAAGLTPDQIGLVQQLAEHVGPLLRLKWSLDRPLAARFAHAVRSYFDEDAKGGRQIKITVASVIGLCLLGLFALPVSTHLKGQARLEPLVQRMLSAPIDGYLKEVSVRPGDRVQARQVLAELNNETLLTERRKLEAEAAQLENAVGEAMAKADRTQVALQYAKLDEIRAQMALITQQLERIQLAAPFDGVVIKGDLTQLLGSPLKRGDALLTISQGTGFRVIVEVPEREIADIKIGQPGRLVLSALPSESYAFRIVRITPVATVASDKQNVFEVEATLEGTTPNLVPGLKGVAKIAIEDRPIGWNWTRRAWQALSFLIWSHLG